MCPSEHAEHNELRNHTLKPPQDVKACYRKDRRKRFSADPQALIAPRYPATECPPGYRGAATTFTKLIKASARQRRKPPRHPFRGCQKVVHVLRIVALRWSLCSEAQNLAPPASEKAKCRLPCPSARRPTRPSATPSRRISRSSTPLPMLRHRGSWH